ncbi:unnamed protein product, partial [Musa acuminata var. zebrina]
RLPVGERYGRKSRAAATMDSSSGDSGRGGGTSLLSAWSAAASRRYQHLLDKATPHVLRRWAGLAVLALVYAARVWIVQGFYIVSYALGIYVLNLFIAFLSPQVDPEIQDLVAGPGPSLPTRSSDEFRPFVRRLPEFKFWVQLHKVLSQGYDDTCWPLQTKNFKFAGEVKLIMHFQNALHKSPAHCAPSAPPYMSPPPVIAAYAPPYASPYTAGAYPGAASYASYPPPAPAPYQTSVYPTPPPQQFYAPQSYPPPSYPPQPYMQQYPPSPAQPYYPPVTFSSSIPVLAQIVLGSEVTDEVNVLFQKTVEPLRHELLQSITNMSSQGSRLQSKWQATTTRSLPPLLTLLVLVSPVLALGQDGVLLLKFKSSILSDPLAVLRDWNYYDATPCSWNGVVCMGFPDAAAITWTPPPPPAANTGGGGNVQVPTASRVISLVLPNSRLLGSVPPELGLLEHLRHLDLSGNMLNGTLPPSLFNASELRVLSLANNAISGKLPELDGRMSSSLQVLNLSDNALIGRLPANLSRLPNLTVVSLANNYLYGQLPGGGFERLQYLDLSSNLVNGSLPTDLGGPRLRYLNLSYNRLTGAIPLELGATIPANATVDLSFNNLTGEIPHGGAFAAEKPMAFVGNPSLCGRPLRNPCAIPSIPSTVSDHPNSSIAAPQKGKSPPAFAAIPKNTDGTSPAGGGQSSAGRGTLRPLAVIAITVGDLAGVGILFVVFLYLYHVKKKKKTQEQRQQKEVGGVGLRNEPPPTATTASPESKTIGLLSCCLRKKGGGDGGDTEETSETSGSSETEGEVEEAPKREKDGEDGRSHSQQKLQGATLVMVDGETELEIETLLKASAYILGASASSIVYKAVLADGTALAVRRIGEGSVIGKLKDFGAQVRSIAKFRHPNLLRLRGFSWGADEKLLIHDYAPNGSLANISLSKKLGSSPLHLSWEARLGIARGVARGLAYIHEKKCSHGNLKPSNILLDSDMEPKIGDFGLDRVMLGAGASARQFGSKRSMHSSISLPDLSSVAGASPSAPGGSSSSALAPPPYQAPESLKNLKPSAKWDVYSFGMVLLELVAGRVFSEVELSHWNAGLVVEEKNRLLRMADAAIRGEVEGKEEALLCCIKLGFACCAMAPQRRPSMKEAVQVLDNISPLPHPQPANVLLSNHSKCNP